MPRLEVTEVGPTIQRDFPPILCVHGAFGGAWMWEDFVLPRIGERGRQALAFSFRGHGRSDGKQKLPSATLADYSEDLLRVFERLNEPPIVIAHSLGALLAQRLIGYVPIKAIVMVAPLPPEGMLMITPGLLFSQPSLWQSLPDVLKGSPEAALAKVESLIFSKRLSRSEVARHLPKMVMEGTKVLFETHLPFPVLPASLAKVPTLVLGGDRDVLVPSFVSWRTALYHGAEYRVLRGRGHVPQLEPGAEELANDVLDWLEEQNA